MKEYRIVCTRDMHHNYNGKDEHIETALPIMGNGVVYRKKFDNLEDAEKKLDELKATCAVFDEKHQEERRDAIKHRHSNLRIQSREVTEWAEV